MKRLTLEQTWSRCLVMWRWVVKEYERRPLVDVEALKVEWLKDNDPEGAAELMAWCYFCEYNWQQDGIDCKACPGRIADRLFNCEGCHNSPAAFLRKLEQLNAKRKATKKGSKP